MFTFQRPIFFIFILAFCFSCQHRSDAFSKEVHDKDSFEVMSFNLENLFDTEHDIVKGESKQDYMYLPSASELKRSGCAKVRSNYWKARCFETDWTEEKLKLKISQLTRVITRDGTETPDFLAASEIENEKVAKKLAKAAGFDDFVITQGKDKRGIELALFFQKNERIELVSSKEHHPDFNTRSILEVEFLIDKKWPVIFFLNHWPSQGSPAKKRIVLAKMLKDRVEQLRKKRSDVHIMALGDFNTIDSDHPHPFKSVLLKDGELLDLHSSFHQSNKISASVKKMMPLGTYFYAPKMSWNLLDRAFTGKNLADGDELDVDLKSYEVYAPSFMTEEKIYSDKTDKHFGSVVQGVPKRANFNAGQRRAAGFSDHFPLVFTFGRVSKEN